MAFLFYIDYIILYNLSTCCKVCGLTGDRREDHYTLRSSSVIDPLLRQNVKLSNQQKYMLCSLSLGSH